MTILILLIAIFLLSAAFAALYFARPDFRAGVEAPKYEMLVQEKRFNNI